MAWFISLSRYVPKAISNVKIALKKKDIKLSSTSTSSLPKHSHSGLDTSDQLGEVDHRYYQSLITILRWIVELGRIGFTQVSQVILGN